MSLFLLNSHEDLRIRAYLALLALFALTPLCGILLFKVGITIRYHQLNALFLFGFLLLTIRSVLSKRALFKAIIPLLLWLITAFVIFTFSNEKIFEINSGSDVFGMLLLNLGPQLFAILLLRINLDVAEIKIMEAMFYTGLFVALASIIVFLMLLTGQYETISEYMISLGLETYIDFVDAFRIRPSGYFFDIHSQYYLPMISLVLLRDNKVVANKGSKFIFYLILVISILVSGVKAGYLTLLVLCAFWFIRSLNNLKSYLYLLIAIIAVFIADFLSGNNIIQLWNRIWSHDIIILIEHFFSVPLKLYKEYPSTFLFGGQPHLANYVYSEVYLVQLIYYVGIFGLSLFYLIPLLYLFIKDRRESIRSLILIFALSLIHYSVFKIGVNMIGSSLIFLFFYKHILYEKYHYARVS